MKWLILTIYNWWAMLLWQNNIKAILADNADKYITAKMMSYIWEKTPLTLMLRVPRTSYSEIDVVTATPNVVDLIDWLYQYRAIVTRFSELTPEEMNMRPEDTYIPDASKITDPMQISLDNYMTSSRHIYGVKTIATMYDIVKDIELCLESIDDKYAIDKAYFTRRAEPYMRDLWEITKALVTNGKYYVIETEPAKTT